MFADSAKKRPGEASNFALRRATISHEERYEHELQI
jgi:hypothetical protein